MAQWGKCRHLIRGQTAIRVLPHVATRDVWSFSPDDPIDDIVLIHVAGSSREAGAMLEELRGRFLSRPYRDFVDAARRSFAA